MIFVDANVLLYAVNRDSARHDEAREWLAAQLDSNQTVALDWVVLLAFVRIATSRRIFPSPLTPRNAFQIVADWLAHPNVVIVSPDIGHGAILSDLLERAGTAGNLVNDAHLAALALSHGGTVASYDGDFNRFGVRWMSPGM